MINVTEIFSIKLGYDVHILNLFKYTFIHYSYVPSEDEPIVIYEKPGVSIDVSKNIIIINCILFKAKK